MANNGFFAQEGWRGCIEWVCVGVCVWGGSGCVVFGLWRDGILVLGWLRVLGFGGLGSSGGGALPRRFWLVWGRVFERRGRGCASAKSGVWGGALRLSGVLRLGVGVKGEGIGIWDGACGDCSTLASHPGVGLGGDG